MSGLVAIFSPDPRTLGRSAQALSRLRHLEEYETRVAHAPCASIGVCGRAREISLATVSGGAESGATRAAGAGEDMVIAGDESRVAALAGEVFNLAALRRELGLAPEAPAAAVVLAAEERWGERLFARLEGHFALISYDARAGRAIVGPDTYGVAFVHSVRLGGDLLVATEAKAFTADPRFRPRLDPEAAACVVALGHEFGRGLFAGVDAVPQGHHAVVENGGITMVRHWDPRDAVGDVRGRAYVEHLRGTIEELAAEVFDPGGSLLPLTGGLDSRLLAAARPRGADVHAFTFGCMADSDCQRAREIATACGMSHQAIPFETDYVARHAAATTWLTEGRLTPAENTTGLQMPRLAAHRGFVSGVDCGLGRRFSKAKTVFPDWALTGLDTPAFDAWLHLRFARSGMSPEEAAIVFGRRAEEVRGPGIEALDRYIDETRGMTGVDRIDLYFVGGRARGWRTSGLGLAGTWIPPRAPFLTRRWIDAVLAGAPAERLDDLPRLRLIRQLDPAVARVPWVMTRLPLGTSEYILRGASQTARVGLLARERLPGGRGGADGTPRTGAARGGLGDMTAAPEEGRPAPAAAGTRREAFTKRYMTAVKGAYHRIYTYGDHREEWLRGPSRAYVEGVLLSSRLGDRGLADAAGVRRLVGEHMAGRDHTLALSILLGLELWSRLFVDGDSPPPLPPSAPGS
jgi:hypothetical protein